jgi:hypothetical protein
MHGGGDGVRCNCRDSLHCITKCNSKAPGSILGACVPCTLYCHVQINRLHTWACKLALASTFHTRVVGSVTGEAPTAACSITADFFQSATFGATFLSLAFLTLLAFALAFLTLLALALATAFASFLALALATALAVVSARLCTTVQLEAVLLVNSGCGLFDMQHITFQSKLLHDHNVISFQRKHQFKAGSCSPTTSGMVHGQRV